MLNALCPYIQMSIGNVMCPMDPMDLWKCPMNTSLVRSIRTKLLHNRVGILHQRQTGLPATKFLPLNCIHLFYHERQSIYASFYNRTRFEFRYSTATIMYSIKHTHSFLPQRQIVILFLYNIINVYIILRSTVKHVLCSTAKRYHIFNANHHTVHQTYIATRFGQSGKLYFYFFIVY